MQLTILGGGGFRVPLVYGALQSDHCDLRVDRVVLHDVDPERLSAVERVLAQMRDTAGGPAVRSGTHLDDALGGADFVFSAMRIGGLAGRTADERVALDLGLLGQETTGPGGVAYGLRTVPAAVHVAERVRAVAPGAWVINFTNPAGMITEAMQSVLDSRVIGICDTPVGLGRRAARALDLDPTRATFDYAGINHLGWLRSLPIDGADALPRLLEDPQRLSTIEEGRLFGVEWLHDLGMIPGEYLYYYYFTRDAISSIKGGPQTRGELLLDQQSTFYQEVCHHPDAALATWRAARQARDATYMKESRSEGEERDAADVAGGGYEAVALALMTALARDEPTHQILNVRNGSTLPGLPPDAVVEVPCVVDSSGATPTRIAQLTGHPAGLVQQVKAVEQLTIRAALEGSERLARMALALHPLVDSVTVARILLQGYRERIPSLDEVFHSNG
ncbi:6-phospho-beta-glucosidase [Leekyejoonella antrihumi]|uniref:6-phospho-beta-glucosidase n=1 Tax=Leekyejoonella antrihumi TaxID=1660198 RepID=A0A563E3L5_9MICO|nr:6-phospho-beta-glucosidase [Leekyejoonella antrihumi]TWP36791.1 6-phospho-beta-glucosidase [Leekyejoonella antrihumi]